MRGGKREGAGRKPGFEKTSVVPVRMPDRIIALIPEPRSRWIRELVERELNG